ncbi:hypothetical protein [Streptomyces sp. NPDC055189]
MSEVGHFVVVEDPPTSGFICLSGQLPHRAGQVGELTECAARAEPMGRSTAPEAGGFPAVCGRRIEHAEFHMALHGNTDRMAQERRPSDDSAGSTRRSTKQTAAQGRSAAKTGAHKVNSNATAQKAKQESAQAAEKAKGSAEEAADAAGTGAHSLGLATQRAKQAAAAGIESGSKTVVSATGKVASTAAAGWTLVKNRKAIAAGAAAGVVSVAGVAFTAGRRTAKVQGGPLTRLTHGRI